MKRFLSILCVIALVAALLCGCSAIFSSPGKTDSPGSLGTDLSVYPVYENLTQEELAIYRSICTAIENHSSDKIHIGTYATETELENAQTRLGQLIRELAFACPDYFWVNPYHYNVHTAQTATTHQLQLELEYILTQDQVIQMKPAYDARVSEIVSAAKEIPDTFDAVLYVYDAIMGITQYDYALAESDDTSNLGRTAYGCLVDGQAVCSGYALAFRSIMEKLGIECGVEFNSYSSYNISGDGHVWNYCKLDGEYYYFDLTWDDTAFDSDEYRNLLPYSHLFFGISADELGASTYDIDPDAPTPECNGTAYNYFIHEGLNFSEYDYNAVKSTVKEHSAEKCIILRFDSYFELEQAVDDLITNQRIFDILPNLESVSYVICQTDHHLMLIF